MKIQKLILAFILASFVFVSCKEDAKKTDTKDVKKEVATENLQKLNLNISGMTCEIGCAKTIASKLSKKEGVTSAKVIFKDSLAVIKYDANKTSKKDLIAFVDGIAGGNTYKASETDRVAKSCKTDGAKPTCDKKDKKSCDMKNHDKKNCKKMADCKDKKDCKKSKKCSHKTKEECKKAGCDKKMAANCTKKEKDCKKKTSCDKKDKKA